MSTLFVPHNLTTPKFPFKDNTAIRPIKGDSIALNIVIIVSFLYLYSYLCRAVQNLVAG